MKRILSILAMVVIAVATSLATVQAQTESVFVDLFFNIGAVDELTVTLLGQSAVTSAPGAGTALPANIEFNVSGDTEFQNASVVGGSTQDGTNPIVSLDNTGTTNLIINISINASMPTGACTMVLRYLNDTAPYSLGSLTPQTNGATLTNVNITVNTSFEPADATIGIWLYNNFSGCGDGDDTIRRFRIFASRV